MIRLFFVLFITTSLYANKLIDIYLDKGITAVENQIQQELASKAFWEEELKDYNVTLGYYQNLDTLLVANKKEKTLEVYKNNHTKLEHVTTHNVIVGKNGDKQKEGDLKTPLGVYKITKRFVPTDQFYGPLAYALSYPNTMDKVEGKNGYGIWIHGSPLDGSERDPMSKGCIVMSNDMIELFDKKIEPKNTITIVGEKEIPKITHEEMSILLSTLFKWKNSWKYNKLDEYLNFYDENFKRFNGIGKKEFSKMKQYIFSQDDAKDIDFKNINVIPYPNEEKKKLFKISFFEDYRTKRHRYQGTKELFVELKADKFLILVEK